MIQCPACHGRQVEPLYSAGPQPLMALNLPNSYEEAKNAPTYPMNFYICLFCGHVYNADFDYAKIPYEEDSNLMFNQGSSWKIHMERLAELLRKYYLQGKTIIDIGAGDGGFLELLKSEARCIAFEPGVDHEICTSLGLETYADYFIPQRDLRKFKPDILTCRHVLEHLQHPRDFVAEIAHYANECQYYPIMLAEVPCITKALNTHRITDFLYEHVSNFTQRSLEVMFESAGWETLDQFSAYNDEVAVWIGRPMPLSLKYTEQQAKDFRKHTWEAVSNIDNKLNEYQEAGLSVVFFGATGKGAAFLNAYHLDGYRVIDSDICKVGKHVPGTGQEIEHVNDLRQDPVDVIIITTRWRAADIYDELRDIEYGSLQVLEHDQLVEYTKEMK